MTDRYKEICERWPIRGECGECSHETQDIAWLIAEVERLKWFEENMLPRANPNFMEHNGCHVCDSWTGKHKPDCEYVVHGGKR